jgi:DNA-binding NarL/FixJ family response regulator
VRAIGLRRDAAGALPGTRPSPLTPEEHAVTALAASGLTNKQIADRLYLSHRTVAARLHQVFPKLGVTSRAGLRDALAELSARHGRVARDGAAAGHRAPRSDAVRVGTASST